MPAPDKDDFLPTRHSLLSRLRDAGDHESWQNFFDLYWRLLYNFARRAGLNDAEAQDVVQETVIDVAKQMPEFRYDSERGSFKSWLLLIVRRRISDFFRRQQYKVAGRSVARQQPLDSFVAETHATPEADLDRMWSEEWEQHIRDRALEIVKEQVKPLQFQMFQLHVIKGMSAGDVAARLGVKGAEIYWAKYRVGRLLRRAKEEAERGSAAAR